MSEDAAESDDALRRRNELQRRGLLQDSTLTRPVQLLYDTSHFQNQLRC